jgi:hypothetical protein
MSWNYPFRKSKRIRIKKSDRERILFYLEDYLIKLDEKNRSKFECAKNFVKDLCGVDDLENLSINLSRMSSQTLIFLFVCFLMEYEDSNQYSKKYLKYDELGNVPPDILKKIKGGKGKLKIIEKDTVCVTMKVEDLLPIAELSEPEARNIECLLDKIGIDLEIDKDILLSTKELILILTQIMRISKESL